jgi:GT2 family glycosyltransferase
MNEMEPSDDAALPRVVVMVCCYNARPFLPDCFGSLEQSLTHVMDSLRVSLLAVDNASSDDTALYLRTDHPAVHVLSLPANVGFAGGNNAGWQYVQDHWPDTEFLVLLNQDTLVDPDWLVPLVHHLQRHPGIACVQPKIMLHPRTDTFNTTGNRSHYLGFGYMTGYGQKDQGQFETMREIDFASGAAVMIRTNVLRQTGLFDEVMFAYLEDADLAWRCRLLGYKIAYEPASRVYHKYEVKAPFKAYFLLERNRWWMLLTCYKWPTLALLIPALLFMEAGQWLFAFQQNLFKERLRVYRWFISRANRKLLWQRRRSLQRSRLVSDRRFSASFTGVIRFEAIDNVLLTYVANPLLKLWWMIVRSVMFW